MLDRERPGMVKRFPIPLPKKWTAQVHSEILLSIAIMMNSKEIDTQVTDQLLQVSMYNKITNLLPALYYGLYYNEVAPANMLDYYEKHYGKIPSSKADLNVILKDIERLTGKYKELFPDNKPVDIPNNTDNKLKFEKLILGMEMTLELPIPRNSKLYQLETYYTMAVERIEQQKKQMAKWQK